MAVDFYSDATSLLQATQRDAKAWLGALQYLAYSMPKRTGALKKADGGEDAAVPSRVNLSADQWFESVRSNVEGALKSAESSLANEWGKRRDPRHSGEEARDSFAHAYEDNVARIASAILDAEDDIASGALIPNRQAREALGKVKEDLRKMISLYTDHCYELTFSEREGSLLSLRARIVDGNTKAL